MSTTTIEVMNGMKTENKLRNWVQPIFILYFALFSVFLFAQALKNPSNNWDMIAYAGSVKSFETDDKKEIHDFAYSELKKYVDAETFQELTASSAYRETLYKDPESFWQVLPWYQIRPVYTGMMYALNKAGINIYFASYLISAVAVFIGLWIFYLAFRPHIAAAFWFALPFFVVLNGTTQIAHFSSPDGLAFLWTSILSYFFIRRHKLFLWLLPLSIFVRTDMIFLVALFLAYLFWSYTKERRKSIKIQKKFQFRIIKTLRGRVVAAGFASLLFYLVINVIYGNYGWATVFHLMFVERINYPADTVVHIEFMQYIKIVIQNLPSMLQNNAFDLFVGIFILMMALLLNLSGVRKSFVNLMRQRIDALMVISFFFVVIHFLIFPQDESRFFIGQYLIGLLVFLSMLTRLRGSDPIIDQKERRKH